MSIDRHDCPSPDREARERYSDQKSLEKRAQRPRLLINQVENCSASRGSRLSQTFNRMGGRLTVPASNPHHGVQRALRTNGHTPAEPTRATTGRSHDIETIA